MTLNSEKQDSARSDSETEDLCFTANDELISNRPEQAIKLYTRVLHETCPGHIGAFLNRCLAFNIMGYPELAVYDAYAALTLAYQCRDLKAPTNRQLITDTLRYAKAEHDAVNEGGWKWVQDGKINVGTEWMSEYLASLILIPEFAPLLHGPPPPANPIPDPTPNASPDAAKGDMTSAQMSTPPPPPPQILPIESMFLVLELMAVWRLIGSLRQCGRGALHDALGMVDDVKSKYSIGGRDAEMFNAIGDLIMQEIEEHHKADPAGLKAFMYTKITMVNRVIYPWNEYEPNLDNFSRLGDTNDALPANSEKAYAMRRKPATAAHATCLRLVATRDIFPGELLVTQKNPLQVTTKSPLESESHTPHCNACAGLMISSDHARRYPSLARFKIQREETDASSSDSEPVGFSTAASRAIMADSGENASSTSAHAAGEDTVPGEQSLLDQVQSVQVDDFGGLRLLVQALKESTDSADPVPRSPPEPFKTPPRVLGTSHSEHEIEPSSDHDVKPQDTDKDTDMTESAVAEEEKPPFDENVNFQRCRRCSNEAAICSTTCAESANEYHPMLCNTGAEEMIRKYYTGRMQRAERLGTRDLNTAEQRLLNDSKFNLHERFLYDLLLVRILSLAADADMHPLAHPDVRWLNGDLAPTPMYVRLLLIIFPVIFPSC